MLRASCSLGMYAWVGDSYVSILVSKFWFLLFVLSLFTLITLPRSCSMQHVAQHPATKHVQGLVYGVYMEFGVFLPTRATPTAQEPRDVTS